MTDLTEQWKKGELPDDEYYCRTTHDSSVRKYYLSDVDTENMIEILAPVPSYEEWKRILHYAGKYEVEYTSCVMDYENLKEENTKLKELLKECDNMNTRLQNALWQWNEDSGLYEECDELEEKVREVLK